jgi:cytoskeletal protein RodZ
MHSGCKRTKSGQNDQILSNFINSTRYELSSWLSQETFRCTAKRTGRTPSGRKRTAPTPEPSIKPKKNRNQGRLPCQCIPPLTTSAKLTASANASHQRALFHRTKAPTTTPQYTPKQRTHTAAAEPSTTKLRCGSWWQSLEKKLRISNAANGWLAASSGAANGANVNAKARMANGTRSLMSTQSTNTKVSHPYSAVRGRLCL